MRLSLDLGLGSVATMGGGASYDAAAEALFARFTTPPTSARKTLINDLIVALKDAGVWTKLDTFYMLAAADNQAARRNWIADQYNLTAVSAPTFTADRGYAGDGVAAYLNTNFTVSTATSPKYLRNSASLGVWSLSDLAGSGRYEIGTPANSVNPRDGSGNVIALMNDFTTASFGASATSLGLFSVNRSAADARQVYKNGSLLGSDSVASATTPSVSAHLLSAGSNFTTRQISIGYFGASFTAGEHASLYAATSEYLQNVGAI